MHKKYRKKTEKMQKTCQRNLEQNAELNAEQNAEEMQKNTPKSCWHWNVHGNHDELDICDEILGFYRIHLRHKALKYLSNESRPCFMVKIHTLNKLKYSINKLQIPLLFKVPLSSSLYEIWWHAYLRQFFFILEKKNCQLQHSGQYPVLASISETMKLINNALIRNCGYPTITLTQNVSL